MKINPNGFREYDARWLYEKDIDLDGITDLGKGLGSQIIKHTKKANPRVINSISACVLVIIAIIIAVTQQY